MSVNLDEVNTLTSLAKVSQVCLMFQETLFTSHVS